MTAADLWNKVKAWYGLEEETTRRGKLARIFGGSIVLLIYAVVAWICIALGWQLLKALHELLSDFSLKALAVERIALIILFIWVIVQQNQIGRFKRQISRLQEELGKQIY